MIQPGRRAQAGILVLHHRTGRQDVPTGSIEKANNQESIQSSAHVPTRNTQLGSSQICGCGRVYAMCGNGAAVLITNILFSKGLQKRVQGDVFLTFHI